jgi:hypothetical protein
MDQRKLLTIANYLLPQLDIEPKSITNFSKGSADWVRAPNSNFLHVMRNLKKSTWGRNFLKVLSDTELFFLSYVLFKSIKSGKPPVEFLNELEQIHLITLVEDLGNMSKEICGTCDGEGKTECDYCSGEGEYECPECNGSGVDEEGETCENCGGRETIPCEDCDGEGSFDCDDCDSTGEIESYYNKDYTVTIWLTLNPQLGRFKKGEVISETDFKEIENSSILILHDEYVPMNENELNNIIEKENEIYVFSNTNDEDVIRIISQRLLNKSHIENEDLEWILTYVM